MELRHLRYFIAVAEEQNITRAAMRLHVSQPPLSRQIRDLERQIGVELFERSAQAVRLTEAGQIFLLEARATLQRAEDAIALTKAVAQGRRGAVRIGYAASPTVEILPRALKAFHETNPEVSTHLRDMSTQAMLRALRERTLDVALIMYLSPRDFAGLAVEELGSHPVRIAFHRKHRFARMREVRIKDVATEPLITFSQSEYPEAHAWLAKNLAPHSRSLNIVEECPSATSLIAAVEAGRGVAFALQSLSLLAGSRLVLRPLKPAPPAAPIAIAYLKEGLSAAAAAFVAAARTAKLHSPTG